MRTSIFLLAAATSIPALSRADIIVDVDWDTMKNAQGSMYQQRNHGVMAGGITLSATNPWHLNSVTLGGIVVLNPMYTPNASDFTLAIKTGGGTPVNLGSFGTVVGTASASAVGSQVVNDDGFTTRFTVTFDNIVGQPPLWEGSPFSGYQFGTYEFHIGLSNTATISTNDLKFVGYFSTQGPGWNGEIFGVTSTGVAPLTVDATNPFAAPIPEPSTYGLILGGLALAGAAIRRRAKRG
jgi:hypothetical protein